MTDFRELDPGDLFFNVDDTIYSYGPTPLTVRIIPGATASMGEGRTDRVPLPDLVQHLAVVLAAGWILRSVQPDISSQGVPGAWTEPDQWFYWVRLMRDPCRRPPREGQRPMTVSQILQEARLKIAAGWCQGNQTVFPVTSANEVTHQRYCLHGALEDASRESIEGRPRALKVICSHLPEPYRPHSRNYQCRAIWEYNDAPGRTQAEVLALIDAALTEVTK
jgi:hypothetical protein